MRQIICACNVWLARESRRSRIEPFSVNGCSEANRISPVRYVMNDNNCDANGKITAA
jgi:hypothetical protein